MKKILIIDDDRIFSKVLRDGLSTHKDKYSVVVASDGEEGIEMARKEKPDLIVLDVVMPKLDGIGALKILKSEDELSNIPVLISTQLDGIEQIGEAIALGVKGYIIKSDFSLDNIIKQIDETLG